MTCRSCGAVIAEKAIVCYRCGAPTAEEPPPVRPAPSRNAGLWVLLVVLVGIALGVAVWKLAQTSVVLSRVVLIAAVVVLAVRTLVRWRRR